MAKSKTKQNSEYMEAKRKAGHEFCWLGELPYPKLSLVRKCPEVLAVQNTRIYLRDKI